MAVNILGVVSGIKSGATVDLPPLKTFCFSVEPLSFDFLFKKKRWRHIYKFLEVGSLTTNCGFSLGIVFLFKFACWLVIYVFVACSLCMSRVFLYQSGNVLMFDCMQSHV